MQRDSQVVLLLVSEDLNHKSRCLGCLEFVVSEAFVNHNFSMPVFFFFSPEFWGMGCGIGTWSKAVATRMGRRYTPGSGAIGTLFGSLHAGQKKTSGFKRRRSRMVVVGKHCLHVSSSTNMKYGLVYNGCLLLSIAIYVVTFCHIYFTEVGC